MGDPAHDAADRTVDEVMAEVRETYLEAQEDAQEALSAYLARFEDEDAAKRRLVDAGELPESEYRSWRASRVMTGKRYASVLDQVAWGYEHANEVAMAALEGRLPEVYAENANFAAYSVCEATGAAVPFDMASADAVQQALANGDALLPVPSVNAAKDAAWNRRLVSSQLAQGLLLGESMPKVARRMQAVTGSNWATALRTARTAVTAAENAGRVSSYKRATALGIPLKKQWMATLDGRTRHSHRQLDGEAVADDEKFSNGCRYPGDPQAAYAETMNCRCTLVAAIEGFERDLSDMSQRWGRLPEGMTYAQWKAEGPRRSQPTTASAQLVKAGSSAIPPKPVWDKENEKFIDYLHKKKEWEAKYGAAHAGAVQAHEADALASLSVSSKKTSTQGPYVGHQAAVASIAEELGIAEDEARGLQASMEAWFDGLYSAIRDQENTSESISAKRADVERVISGMPKYDGSIWRGIGVRGIDPAAEWAVGCEVDMKGISSWSSTRGTAYDFATQGLDGRTPVLFECGNVSGAAVNHLSGMGEDEVLHSASSRFVVKSIEEKGGVWIVMLEEVRR